MEYFTVRSVLDKMDNSDSDFRYMATSDLLSQLTNENAKIKADHDMQKRLCRAVLKLLKDSNSEVQGMATKCLPPLTSFVDLDNAVYIVDTLLTYVLQNAFPSSKSRSSTPDMLERKAVHDVASLALKSILRNLSPNSPKASKMASTIVPPLINSVSTMVPDPNSADSLIDTLELLYELLARIGSLLTSHHRRICDALFVHFDCKSALVRKRAISCLASLAVVCDNSIFLIIVERSLKHIQQKRSQDALRTGVQAISALSKTSGHRLAPHLQVLVPILFDYTSADSNGDDDDDLREHCLQALESFCLRCRREMIPFAEKLAQVSVTLAKYDPNYIMEDDDDGDGDDNMAEDDDDDDDDGIGDEYDDEDYSDDDDSSWKVRRAAVACIHAMIASQLFSPVLLSSRFGHFLIMRFKEREESVKLDIFSAFDQLLRLCGSAHSLDSLTSTSLNITTTAATSAGLSDDAMAVDNGGGGAPNNNNSNAITPEIETLANEGPVLIRGLKRELGSRSAKTKVKAMTLARCVATYLPMLAKPLVNQIITEVQQGLSDSTTGMRTETLLLIQTVVRVGGGTEVLASHIDTLIPCVLSATNDRYYKVTAECMRLYYYVVSFCPTSTNCSSRTSLSNLLPTMYDAAMQRITAQDQDSEVKDAALQFIVAAVKNMYDVVNGERTELLVRVLISRLKNPGTQISTVRHFRSILLVDGNGADYVKSEIHEIAPIVYSFLRKSDQTLRRAAVELLTIVPSLPSSDDVVLIDNISDLISDSDLRIASMALDVSARIINERSTSVMPHMAKSIYPRALQLSMSPLLQGRAIDSLLNLFSSLARVNTPTAPTASPLSIQQILQALEEQAMKVSFGVTTSSSRSSPLYCIGKCIVSVCRVAETQVRIETTRRIIENINDTDFKQRIFALACLAEFGRGSLLPKEGNEKNVVRAAVLQALHAQVEEVKTAAAVALGSLASSDGASGVPELVQLIKERAHQRYLLLLSLKEAISSVDKAHLEPLAPVMLPLLLEQSVGGTANNNTAAITTTAADFNPNSGTTTTGDDNDKISNRGRFSEEESVRTATAECLGLLAEACPSLVMDTLKTASQSPSADIRAAVAAAVKFAVSSSMMSGEMPSQELRTNLPSFIEMIGDGDVTVSKNAVQAVNAIAKSHPTLLINHLAKTLSLIYAHTTKNKQLVRVVDLGPFKHEEDYGLDLRKCAFDCLRTLMSGPLQSSIQLGSLLDHVIVGLRDQADVRAIAQLIVMGAATSENAAQMVNVMDSIVNALDATLKERLKENTVRQEVERYEESIRGALRAIRAMENVPEISACGSFQALLNTVLRTPKLLDRYEAIAQQEVNLLSMNSNNNNNSNNNGGSNDGGRGSNGRSRSIRDDSMRD